MLKVELHAHTLDDPEDYIPHTIHELIDRAASAGYHAVAVTLHNKQLEVEPVREYADRQGLVLLSGIERTIGGKRVLLINFSHRAERVSTFDEIASLKRDEPLGLVVAPHPFFPLPCCLRGKMDEHPEIFDAVELNAMYSPSVNFNRAGARWARQRGIPLVGNADVHRLDQLGTTFSLVEAAPSPNAICQAIREGRVRIESTPLGLPRALWLFGRIVLGGIGRGEPSAPRRVSATGHGARSETTK